MNDFDILFSILTLPEVDFLVPISERLIKEGNRIGFILFHEAGTEILEKKQIPYFYMHSLRKVNSSPKLNERIINEYATTFGICNLRHLLIHEMLGYNRRNEDELLVKVIHYLQILDRIFSENKVKCVIQELGGFSANQCVYYAARKNGVDHVFYEPAAFSKRIVFNLNSYYSDIPERIMTMQHPEEVYSEVESYMRNYSQSKDAVIPFKDKYSFADMTLKKIFSFENAKRLRRKLIHKYISKKKEEYDEIGWVVRYNMLKYTRRWFLQSFYREPDFSCRYIYFPFHVPHDVQLTSRSRLFYFQEGFVEYIARIIPPGYKLFIKEHPASIGGHSVSVLRKLLKQHSNIVLIHPRVNSYHLIKNAALIISINSKVGFEALMQGKKVVVVGDAFYKKKGVTYDVCTLNDLESVINEALKSEKPSQREIMDFLVKTYEWSYPCELFFLEKANLERSCESFYKYLKTETFRELKIQ